jgi:hypothetical protein
MVYEVNSKQSEMSICTLQANSKITYLKLSFDLICRMNDLNDCRGRQQYTLDNNARQKMSRILLMPSNRILVYNDCRNNLFFPD